MDAGKAAAKYEKRKNAVEAVPLCWHKIVWCRQGKQLVARAEPPLLAQSPCILGGRGHSQRLDQNPGGRAIDSLDIGRQLALPVGTHIGDLSPLHPAVTPAG